MAVKPVREVLQNEIIAALKTSPSSTKLNTTSPLVGAYPSDKFDMQNNLDPRIFPCVIVNMPKPVSSEAVSDYVNRTRYETELFIYQSECEGDDADIEMSDRVSAIRASLAARDSNPMRRLGLYLNCFTVSSPQWGRAGQDACYRIVVSCTCTPGSTTDTVSDAV